MRSVNMTMILGLLILLSIAYVKPLQADTGIQINNSSMVGYQAKVAHTNYEQCVYFNLTQLNSKVLKLLVPRVEKMCRIEYPLESNGGYFKVGNMAYTVK